MGDYIALIEYQDSLTKEKKIVKEYFKNCSKDGIDFMITEGNYSCDCVRHKMFYGFSEEVNEYPCGDSRFKLINFYINNFA
jgi:hypothetical protein